jgi:hypothetical protein
MAERGPAWGGPMARPFSGRGQGDPETAPWRPGPGWAAEEGRRERGGFPTGEPRVRRSGAWPASFLQGRDTPMRPGGGGSVGKGASAARRGRGATAAGSWPKPSGTVRERFEDGSRAYWRRKRRQTRPASPAMARSRARGEREREARSRASATVRVARKWGGGFGRRVERGAGERRATLARIFHTHVHQILGTEGTEPSPQRTQSGQGV